MFLQKINRKFIKYIFFIAIWASCLLLLFENHEAKDVLVPYANASASGGTVTYSGAYTIHTFTSSGTFTVTGGPINVEYLIVAGGGGGGGTYRFIPAGGGGAGGLLAGTSANVQNGAYTITVGLGGVGGSNCEYCPGSSGGNSSFNSLVSIGGGGGASRYSLATSGGSGGGGVWDYDAGMGTAGQGNRGGYGNVDSGGIASITPENPSLSSFSTEFYSEAIIAQTSEYPGGGGGAGSVGSSGPGGSGVSSSISGTSQTYAVGGSSGIGDVVGNGANGVAGTGNGGGGANATLSGSGYLGGSGGAGIVILRYLNTYTVIYDGNGGSCSPSPQVISSGGSTSAPTCSRTGYTLLGYTRTIGSGGTLNTSTGVVSNVTGNQTIRADWIINSYTVSYNQNNGCCTPTSRVVNYNSTAAGPSCYRTMYTLTGYTRTLGSGGTLNSSTGEVTNVSGNQTIRADWSYNSPTMSNCNPLPGDSTHTITTNCSFPYLIDGVDAGTGSTNSGVLTVSSGVLTINSTQTIIAGTINLTGGSIAMISGAQIKMNTPIYGLDNDGDAWTGSWTFNTTGGAGYVRRNTLQSLSIADCNDGVYEGANLCCAN